MSKFDFMKKALEARDAKGQRRRLRTITPFSGPQVQVDGKKLINFCSNDYLGLSQHPLLRERAEAFMSRYGAGATASRLICGNLGCFDQVERKLADLKGTETALIFNAGYQANVSLIPTLADRHALILSDTLNHSSLIMGTLLSRCRMLRFRHNDMDHLKQLLDENQAKGFSRIFIVTESVFSMDGDQSDIDALVELAKTYNAILYLDEAHATGIFGENGMGLSCGKAVDIVMGTFSKGCGSFGAYIACSQSTRDYILNYCSGLIYSTGLPPGVIGTIDAALDLLPGMEKERQRVSEHADFLRSSLQSLGWDTGASTTQIVPVMVGEEGETLKLSKWLEDKGMMATAIRPPTVPKGESRLRLTVSALHTKAHMIQLIDAFRAWREVT
jgi:8-amino-7-oxononanoate synthase